MRLSTQRKRRFLNPPMVWKLSSFRKQKHQMTSAEDLRARKDEGRHWRWAGVGEKLEKEGAIWMRGPLQKRHEVDLWRAFSYVQCLDDRFVHQRRGMVVCYHWNATETFLSLLTLSPRSWNWTMLSVTLSHSWAVVSIASILLSTTVLTRKIPLGASRKLELGMSLGSSASFISMEHSLSSISHNRSASLDFYHYFAYFCDRPLWNFF